MNMSITGQQGATPVYIRVSFTETDLIWNWIDTKWYIWGRFILQIYSDQIYEYVLHAFAISGYHNFQWRFIMVLT